MKKASSLVGVEEFSDEEVKKKKKKQKNVKSGGFQKMGLSYNILKGVLKKGYKVPTPIQRKTIPVILAGNDVVAMARTGSGKTAAFLVPLLEKLQSHALEYGARGVILSPTRELATQTLQFCKDLGKFTDLRFCLLVGGDSLEDQFSHLTANPDILIATPGRLMHHLLETGMSLQTVEYVVFDEADRLFELGFADQLQEITKRLSDRRQTLLFSATLPSKLVEFARAGLSQPVVMRLDTDTSLSENLKLAFFTLRPQEKTAALLYLLKDIIPRQQQTIIFTATRHHVEYLHDLLNMTNCPAVMIYGTMDQTARKIALQKFRNKQINLLIVTDLAARGIDVPLLDNVINYDFPSRPKLFVHRVGRAARAGRTGTAYSFVAHDEFPYMLDLHLFLGLKPLNKESAEPQPNQAYYGCVPQAPLENLAEIIRSCHNVHSDLESAFKVTVNAYKQYFKTRPLPSSESVKRAKEFTETGLHPMFADRVDENDKTRLEYVQSLKKFRPPQTVLEMGSTDVGKGTKSTNENEAMKKKRELHDTIIAKVKNQKSTEIIDNTNDEEILPEANTEDSELTESSTSRKRKREAKKKRPTSFRDEEFFLSHFPKNKHKEEGLTVNGDIALDLLPDEKDTLIQKKNQLVWDRKKKRFVTAGSLEQRKKKMKNESGAVIDPKAPLKVSRYEQWTKKTKKKIPIVGEKEDPTAVKEMAQKRFRHNQTKQSADDAKLGLKTKEQIHKERKKKERRKNPKKKAKTVIASGTPTLGKGSAWTRSKTLAY